MKYRPLILALLALIAGIAPAFAQNRVILTDDQLAPGTKPPAICVQEGEAFLHIAAQYPTVHQWTFYIVCTERSWNHFLHRSRQDAHGVLLNGMPYSYNPNVQIYATTYAQSHVTYIRGDKLIHPDPAMTPSHIVVHELARIIMNIASEAQVDQQAMQWIAEHHQTSEPVGPGTPNLPQSTVSSK
jgi:hypothetical protein